MTDVISSSALSIPASLWKAGKVKQLAVEGNALACVNGLTEERQGRYARNAVSSSGE